MNRTRILAIAAAALLVMGGIGAVTARAYAQTAQPTAQVQGAEKPDAENDTETGDGEVGDQVAADTETSESSDGQDAAPTGTPAITADAAQKTAEAHLNAGAASKVTLDDENGTLVYSVDIGGVDVKVDAMTGIVIGTDNAED